MALQEEILENLDGLFPDDLREYANKLKALPLTDDDHQTRGLLVDYALTKAEAIEKRKDGEINRAERLEAYCQAVYRCLPMYARW